MSFVFENVLNDKTALVENYSQMQKVRTTNEYTAVDHKRHFSALTHQKYSSICRVSGTIGSGRPLSAAVQPINVACWGSKSKLSQWLFSQVNPYFHTLSLVVPYLSPPSFLIIFHKEKISGWNKKTLQGKIKWSKPEQFEVSSGIIVICFHVGLKTACLSFCDVFLDQTTD